MHLKLFNETSIYKIYQEHVLKDSKYYKKFEKLPLELNNKKWKWENKDFPRIWCILDFKEWVEKYNIKHNKKILTTCKDDPELEYISWDKNIIAEYANGSNDFHKLNLSEKEFDFIIFNQTIEHLYNPFISMFNLYEHLKPGGFLFTSVPTINIPHMLPFHYNGYTPTGLCMLMKSCGFTIKELGFWGNRKYINYIFEHNDWPDYRNLLEGNGTIPNEKGKEVQCWVLVQK